MFITCPKNSWFYEVWIWSRLNCRVRLSIYLSGTLFFSFTSLSLLSTTFGYINFTSTETNVQTETKNQFTQNQIRSKIEVSVVRMSVQPLLPIPNKNSSTGFTINLFLGTWTKKKRKRSNSDVTRSDNQLALSGSCTLGQLRPILLRDVRERARALFHLAKPHRK